MSTAAVINPEISMPSSLLQGDRSVLAVNWAFQQNV